MEVIVILIFWILLQLIFVLTPKYIRLPIVYFEISPILIIIHIILGFFSIILLVFQINIRGFWTDKIIFWLFLVLGFIISLSYKSYPSKKNLYFKIFSFIPISILIATFCIPMYGPIFTSRVSYYLIPIKSSIFYSDSKYRVQSSLKDVLEETKFEIYKKEGLFEKLIYSGYDSDDARDISLYEMKDSLFIKFIDFSDQVIFDPQLYRYVIKPDPQWKTIKLKTIN